MTKRAPINLPASVHQLLLNKARQTHRPFNELLQYYAMERFLYRLSKSPHVARFILKFPWAVGNRSEHGKELSEKMGAPWTMGGQIGSNVDS